MPYYLPKETALFFKNYIIPLTSQQTKSFIDLFEESCFKTENADAIMRNYLKQEVNDAIENCDVKMIQQIIEDIKDISPKLATVYLVLLKMFSSRMIESTGSFLYLKNNSLKELNSKKYENILNLDTKISKKLKKIETASRELKAYKEELVAEKKKFEDETYKMKEYKILLEQKHQVYEDALDKIKNLESQLLEAETEIQEFKCRISFLEDRVQTFLYERKQLLKTIDELTADTMFNLDKIAELENARKELNCSFKILSDSLDKGIDRLMKELDRDSILYKKIQNEKELLTELYEKFIKKNRNFITLKKMLINHAEKHPEKDFKSNIFFGYTITKLFTEKIEKMTSGIITIEVLQIAEKIAKDKLEVKGNKLLLKLVSKICEKIGGKGVIWYRNYLSEKYFGEKMDYKMKQKCVVAKFYYTYVNPLNNEDVISLDKFLLMGSKKRRELFIKEYKTLDKEIKTRTSCFETDTLRIAKSLEKIKKHLQSSGRKQLFLDDDFNEYILSSQDEDSD